jgi:uncharacterized Zn finger protein (UPF0148 family)
MSNVYCPVGDTFTPEEINRPKNMETNYAEELGVCSKCGSKNVRNPKTGKIFCADKCWLKRGIGQPVAPQNPAQVNSRPYSPIAETSANVKVAQDNKQESMRIFSSGRDAVLITVAEMAQGNTWSEEDTKRRIEFWKNYLFTNIYVDKPF